MRLRPVLLFLALAGVLRAESPDEVDQAVRVVRQLEDARVELAAKLAPSVCAVFKGGGGGSGVIFTEDGLVLTNFHVTGLANEMRIGLNDQRTHPGVVLGVDPSGDLSVIRLTEDRKWTAAPLGDSDALRQGDYVYAMGNPFLLATDFTPTITFGIVSGINRYQPGSVRGTLLYPDCIQTDASINPGNSGGPLFNFLGQVVGINGRVSLRDRGRVNIGVGYAISSNQIKLALPELRAGKVVQHGTLNATVRSIEDLSWPGGVRVTFDRLLAPGCAHDAGIMIGDALVEFMGHRIVDVNQFSRLIAVLPMGRRVSLVVARYGKEKWEEHEYHLTLDGIPLIKKSDLMAKQVPAKFINHEIDRTLDAARAAVQPIGNETREGTLTVRGRESQPLREVYAGGKVRIEFGEHVRVAGPEGGTDGDEKLTEERRLDMLERVAAWNDLLEENARTKFASIEFTGGALVGGITCDVFKVKTKGDNERIYYVHLDTGRLLRVDLYSRNWVRWISLFFSEWRNAGGLQRPYKVAIWDKEKDNLLQTIEYKSIRRGEG